MNAGVLSGSQLDKLGERLRKGPLILSDLQQLRLFVETLEPFAEVTFRRISDLHSESSVPSVQITRRHAKTVRSIIEKLRRQSISLRQIQDLVGCRIVVPDTLDQRLYKSALLRVFPAAHVVDRTTTPQHGYRAIHFIVRDGNQRFEIQLRTRSQDEWANIVEKIADRVGLEVKYGGGDGYLQDALEQLSTKIAKLEEIEGTFQVRFQDPTAIDSTWLFLYYNGDYLSVLSRTQIRSNTSIIISKLGGEGEDRAVIAEPCGSWEAPEGTIYEYAIDFEDGSNVAATKYVSLLSDAKILDHEIQDSVKRLESLLQ